MTNPDDPLDRVRAVLAAPEDVDMAGVPVDDGRGDGDGLDDDGMDGCEDEARFGPPAPSLPDMPAAARCVGLPLNDFGNGQRYTIHFGEDLIFVPRVGWFVWTGQMWAMDPDGIQVRRKAQQLAGLILDEIAHVTHSEKDQAIVDCASDLMAERLTLDAIAPKDRTLEQKRRLRVVDDELARIADARDRLSKRKANLRSHSRGSGNSPKIKAAIAESETFLARGLNDLDANPLMVNCLSGALLFSGRRGLAASVAVLPHERDQLLTKIMPVPWAPAAPCPMFMAFLERIQPDPEMRAFIRRWFGLSMTSLTGEQKLTFFYGGGANGKSVLVDLMARMMGDYAATAKIESLTGRNRRSGGDATPDLVPLIGARLVRASEPEEGERLQEAKIKELTGGEPILVRALNEDFVEVKPQFKLTISGNHKPEIRGNDDGIWRRVLLVPFDVQIPKDERDPHLGEKLWEERAGILQWMVAGLLDYLQNGLREPGAVLVATEEYREASDPLGNFVEACCVVTGDPGDTIRTATLIEAFNYHRREEGLEQWKGTTVSRQLPGLAQRYRSGSGARLTKGKSSVSQYEGIRFTDVFRRRFDNAPRDNRGQITGITTDADDPDDRPVKRADGYNPDDW
jgi:putative DNA primase/helicase